MMASCTVAGCSKPRYCRGLCATHYRHKRDEELLARGKTCTVEGCGRAAGTGSYCLMHYWRVRKYGDPGGPEPLVTRMGQIAPDDARPADRISAADTGSRPRGKRRDDSWHEVFLDAIAAGASFEEARAKAGVNSTTIYRHRNTDPEFAAAFDAARGKSASTRADRRTRQADDCGTLAGYNRHLYRGEEPCRPCRDANNRYHASRPGDRTYANIRARARTRLVSAHKPEHAALRRQERQRVDHSPDGAWIRAANTLVRRYPKEYRALLAEELAACHANCHLSADRWRRRLWVRSVAVTMDYRPPFAGPAGWRRLSLQGPQGDHIGELVWRVCDECRIALICKIGIVDAWQRRGLGRQLVREALSRSPHHTWTTTGRSPEGEMLFATLAQETGVPFPAAFRTCAHM